MLRSASAFSMTVFVLGACAATSTNSSTSSSAKSASSSSSSSADGEENDENFAPQRTVQLADPPATPVAVPTSCVGGAGAPDAGGAAADLCMTGDAFAKRFCNGSFPDVALVLMGKSSPFTRMYLRGDVDAWNADGGMSTRARLQFDEEMLVLRRRNAPANSIVVGAGAGYQVMRWDGSCFTLDDGELTTKKPPVAKHPPIPWRRLTDKTRDHLLKNPKILSAYQKRGKECKGQSTGDTTKACEAADTALSVTIVAEMRAGYTLPTPEPL